MSSSGARRACWRRETRPTTVLRCLRAAQVTGCRARCARGPARLPFRVRQPSPALALPPRAQADFHVKLHPERLKAEAEFMQELRDMGLTGDELREEAMGTRIEGCAQLVAVMGDDACGNELLQMQCPATCGLCDSGVEARAERRRLKTACD